MTPGHVPRRRRTATLASVAGVSAIGTVLSRATGMGRTLATAYALGANGVSDAYNLANTTPNIVYDLVLGGVLSGTLVPVFVKALNTPADEGGEAAGWEAISSVCTVLGVALAGVTLLFFAMTPLIIRFYTLGSTAAQLGAERALATSLLYLFVPQLALYGTAAIVTAILQARRRYAAPMYTPILNNVVVIGVLLVFSAGAAHVTPAAVRQDHGAVALLGLGTTAGVALMVLALLPALRSAGVRLRLRWDPGHPAVRTIVGLSGWTVGFVLANQVAYLVVILLSNHTPGDYSAYSYAYLFMLLPHGIWAVSVMAPMETDVATAWQAGDTAAARRSLVEAIWLVLVVVTPAGLGIAVLARPAIAVVLAHGNLGAAGAASTSGALAAMAVGLPAFSLYLVSMRAYQAMQDTRTMFLIYLVENGLNVAFDLALYPRFGLRGLAMGLSLAYAGGVAVAVIHLRRRMGGLGGAALRSGVGSVVVGAGLAACAAWAVSAGLAHLPGGTRPFGTALRVALAVGAGVGVYLKTADVLGFAGARRRLGLGRPVS